MSSSTKLFHSLLAARLSALIARFTEKMPSISSFDEIEEFTLALTMSGELDAIYQQLKKLAKAANTNLDVLNQLSTLINTFCGQCLDLCFFTQEQFARWDRTQLHVIELLFNEQQYLLTHIESCCYILKRMLRDEQLSKLIDANIIDIKAAKSFYPYSPLFDASREYRRNIFAPLFQILSPIQGVHLAVGGKVMSALLYQENCNNDFDATTTNQTHQSFYGKGFKRSLHLINLFTYRDWNNSIHIDLLKIHLPNLKNGIHWLRYDVEQRDYTVSSIYCAEDGSVKAPIRIALYDLKYKILRIIGNPEERFTQDVITVLRGFKLMTKGFVPTTDLDCTFHRWNNPNTINQQRERINCVIRKYSHTLTQAEFKQFTEYLNRYGYMKKIFGSVAEVSVAELMQQVEFNPSQPTPLPSWRQKPTPVREQCNNTVNEPPSKHMNGTSH